MAKKKSYKIMSKRKYKKEGKKLGIILAFLMVALIVVGAVSIWKLGSYGGASIRSSCDDLARQKASGFDQANSVAAAFLGSKPPTEWEYIGKDGETLMYMVGGYVQYCSRSGSVVIMSGLRQR